MPIAIFDVVIWILLGACFLGFLCGMINHRRVVSSFGDSAFDPHLSQDAEQKLPEEIRWARRKGLAGYSIFVVSVFFMLMLTVCKDFIVRN